MNIILNKLLLLLNLFLKLKYKLYIYNNNNFYMKFNYIFKEY